MSNETIHILLVDDEPEFRESTARTLSRRGFSVDGVGSGQAALDYLKTATPDLVILDLKMAGMDGITALQRIRENHARLPVIILTGHGDYDSALSGIKLEVVDFMQKPVDIDFLATKVRKILSHHEDQRAMRERSVTDLMIPAESYKILYADQTIKEALVLLRESLHSPVAGKVTEVGHRSVLVKERDESLVAVVRVLDILHMASPFWLIDSPYGSYYTGMFLAQCKTFGEARLGSFIDVDELTVIAEDTPLMEAVVIMARERLINLPVMRDGKIVGMLRDKDLFHEILNITLDG